MQPTKERSVYSTNFAYHRDATACSYVPKKKKGVVILSSMHMSGEVEETLSAKLEIIKYYYKTKCGVDTINAGWVHCETTNIAVAAGIFLQYDWRHWLGMLRHL